MKKKITAVVLTAIITGAAMMTGCAETDTSKQIGVYDPFWESSTMLEETVVLVENEQGVKKGTLLFEPTKILSVKDYALESEYDPSEYTFEGRELIASESSTMPYLTQAQYEGSGLESLGISTHPGKLNGTLIPFTEGAGLVMKQVNVTYEHAGVWGGNTPEYAGEALSGTISRLREEKKLNLFLFGDSISTGANSSGKLGIAPYLDDWGTGVQKQLAERYGADVHFVNGSYGGWNSADGRREIDAALGTEQPDLAIIGFGMNDGAHGIDAETYKSNILAIMESVRAKSPDCEFLLIATMLANPLAPQDTIQKQYLPKLREIASAEQGVAVVDMTSFTEELYKYKKGMDFLANNINHPSDFLVRCYVMNIMGTLYEDN